MTCQREKELLEQIEQTGEMYKVSALKLIQDGKRIAELESLNGALCRDNAGFVQERDGLATQNQALRDALATVEGWIIVPERNCSCHISPPCSNCIDKGNAEFDDEQVKAALALPDISAEILKQRDARTLLDAADRHSGGYVRADRLRRMASELEQVK